ncbi:MAG: antitoxin [Acidobacteriota bacterium]
MRIDDDVLRAAKSIAASQGRSLGEVLSQLARRGLQPREPRRAGLVPVFEIDPGAPRLTPEMVREALDDAG